jgi:acyl-CoA hydrolase
MLTPLDTSYTYILPLGSDDELRRRYQVVKADIAGNFRFGLLLEVLDNIAGETSLAYVRRFHPEGEVVTAAIDNIKVRGPAEVTRDLICKARIDYVGRSSMEVGIRIEQTTGPGETAVTHVASCHFTMVARSRAGEGAESLELPPLEYRDDHEKRRAANALARRELYRMQQSYAQNPPTAEEYGMITRLHHAQDEPGFSGLRAGRLVTESWERMYPELEKVPQSIFGGHLIRRAYELAAICAELVAPGRAVIVAVNRINFFHRVLIDDKLHITCRVIHTGKTSISIEADIERVSRDRNSKALSNTCLFTFVSVDHGMRPQQVPTIYPTTYREDELYLAAYRQRALYNTSKIAGVSGQ